MATPRAPKRNPDGQSSIEVPLSVLEYRINNVADAQVTRSMGSYARRFVVGVTSLSVGVLGVSIVDSLTTSEVDAAECKKWDFNTGKCLEYETTTTQGGGGNDGGGNDGGDSNNGNNPAPSKTWEQKVAELCINQPNDDSQATTVGNLTGTDGSGRLVTYIRECGISFVGDYDPQLGRPMTNVEWAILDGSNNMSPNSAQIGALNEYIISMLPAWFEANPQFAPSTTTTVAPTTTVPPTTTIAVTTTVAPTTTVPPTTTIAPAANAKPGSGKGGGVSGPESGTSSGNGIGAEALLIGALIVAGMAGGTVLLARSRRQHSLAARV